MQPKKNRKHTDLKDGYMVRYKLKPSIGTKSHEPKWSSTRHGVIGNPTNNQYLIPGINKSKMWMGHGLLLVK